MMQGCCCGGFEDDEGYGADDRCAGGPSAVLVSEEDGKTAYVACNYADQVAVDLAGWKVEGLIDAGKDADGMAWAR